MFYDFRYHPNESEKSLEEHADIVDLTNQTFWWYGKETGLYYDNPNLVGLGRTFSEIEDISDGKVGYPAGQPRLA
jgi:hypothetical protein